MAALWTTSCLLGQWASRGQVSWGRVLRQVRIRRTLGNKSPSWTLSVTGPGFVGAGALVGENPPHFGQQVACLGNGRHRARFRGVGCSGG